jgi:hypothetical protein
MQRVTNIKNENYSVNFFSDVMKASLDFYEKENQDCVRELQHHPEMYVTALNIRGNILRAAKNGLLQVKISITDSTNYFYSDSVSVFLLKEDGRFIPSSYSKNESVNFILQNQNFLNYLHEVFPPPFELLVDNALDNNDKLSVNYPKKLSSIIISWKEAVDKKIECSLKKF